MRLSLFYAYCNYIDDINAMNLLEQIKIREHYYTKKEHYEDEILKKIKRIYNVFDLERNLVNQKTKYEKYFKETGRFD